MTNPWQFVKETKAELMKVVWPSWAETIRISVAVIILSLIVAAFLGSADFGLSKLVQYLINQN